METRLLAKHGIALAPTLASHERGNAAAAIGFGDNALVPVARSLRPDITFVGRGFFYE